MSSICNEISRYKNIWTSVTLKSYQEGKYLTQAEHVADKGGKWISNYKSKWFS
jgi:hypothetical protein